jgi:hypothetical protein
VPSHYSPTGKSRIPLQEFFEDLENWRKNSRGRFLMRALCIDAFLAVSATIYCLIMQISEPYVSPAAIYLGIGIIITHTGTTVVMLVKGVRYMHVAGPILFISQVFYLLGNIYLCLFIMPHPERLWVYTCWIPVLFIMHTGVMSPERASIGAGVMIGGSAAMFLAYFLAGAPFRPGTMVTDGIMLSLFGQSIGIISLRIMTTFREQYAASVAALEATLAQLEERRRIEGVLEETRNALARINRASVLDTLTTSLAHEINQPLGASTTNAQAAVRWLSGPEPDIAEAQAAMRRVVEETQRAGCRLPLRSDPGGA